MEPLELSLSKVGHCLHGVGGEGDNRMGTAVRGRDEERHPGWEHAVGLCDEVVGMEQLGERGFVFKFGLSCVHGAA